MQIALVYYSYSGNTHQAAQIIAELLGQDNSIKRLRIEAPEESSNFFVQAWRGLTKSRVKIAPPESDLSGYDLIILATPVWAGQMSPAMRSYLEKISGLNAKKVLTFVTYGSGLGKEHCLDALQLALRKKGAICSGRFSLSQFKVSDKLFVENLLKKNLCL